MAKIKSTDTRGREVAQQRYGRQAGGPPPAAAPALGGISKLTSGLASMPQMPAAASTALSNIGTQIPNWSNYAQQFKPPTQPGAGIQQFTGQNMPPEMAARMAQRRAAREARMQALRSRFPNMPAMPNIPRPTPPAGGMFGGMKRGGRTKKGK